MPNIIKPKYSNTAASVPTTTNLADGEFCINTADKIIYQRIGTSIIAVANYSTGGGGGITNSAANNVIPKSDGTNLVASKLSETVNQLGLVYARDTYANSGFRINETTGASIIRLHSALGGLYITDDVGTPVKLLFSTWFNPSDSGTTITAEPGKFQVNGADFVIGNAALATTATFGFLYIGSGAGVPTGTPTLYAGRVPLYIDSTNNRLYGYFGSAWVNLSGSGSSGGLNASDFTAKGQTHFSSASNAVGVLAAPATNAILTGDTAQPLGVKWQAGTAGSALPAATALGQTDKFIIVQSGANKSIAGSLVNPVIKVYLPADVTNNNATANTMADVAGLSWTTVANVRYRFKIFIVYTSAITTTGSRWSLNTAGTITELHYRSEYSLSAATRTTNEGLNAVNLPTASNGTSATIASNIAIVEGIIKLSTASSVIARFASEVASSAIVAKAGISYLEYEAIG